MQDLNASILLHRSRLRADLVDLIKGRPRRCPVCHKAETQAGNAVGRDAHPLRRPDEGKGEADNHGAASGSCGGIGVVA